MNMDKYDTLRNALIIEKNDKLLEEFEKIMIEIDREDNDKYLEEYKKYDYMALTIEDEEERLKNFISAIRSRNEKRSELDSDYRYITGEDADFLLDFLDIDKLPELENRLDTVSKYLSIKDRIVNLSLNIKEYNKELKNNPDNRRINTKLNKSTKKINTLLNSLKKENILVLLYEFCIIDSFDDKEIENSVMLKNILSTKIKKREKKVDKEKTDKVKEENDIEIKVDEGSKKKSINVNDASIFIVPSSQVEINNDDKIVEELEESNYEKSEETTEESKDDSESKIPDIVIINNNQNKKEEQEEVSELEDNIDGDKIDVIDDTQEGTKDNKDESTDEEQEDDYIKQMVPIDMLKLDKIGTVRPVSIMEKLESAQEEEGDLVLPSMGILDRNNDLSIDSNDYLKKSTKNDKIS